MEGKKKYKIIGYVIGLIALVFIAIQLMSIDSFFDNNKEASNTSIENAIRKSALECYALEGSFPPSIKYLQKNYGLIVNEDAYFYHYEPNGSNILPDIKVLRKWAADNE